MLLLQFLPLKCIQQQKKEAYDCSLVEQCGDTNAQNKAQELFLPQIARSPKNDCHSDKLPYPVEGHEVERHIIEYQERGA